MDELRRIDDSLKKIVSLLIEINSKLDHKGNAVAPNIRMPVVRLLGRHRRMFL